MWCWRYCYLFHSWLHWYGLQFWWNPVVKIACCYCLFLSLLPSAWPQKWTFLIVCLKFWICKTKYILEAWKDNKLWIVSCLSHGSSVAVIFCLAIQKLHSVESTVLIENSLNNIQFICLLDRHKFGNTIAWRCLPCITHEICLKLRCNSSSLMPMMMLARPELILFQSRVFLTRT